MTSAATLLGRFFAVFFACILSAIAPTAPALGNPIGETVYIGYDATVIYDGSQNSSSAYEDAARPPTGDEKHVSGAARTFLGRFADLLAAKSISAGERVIAETLAGKGNLTSKLTLSADEALGAGEKFLGSGYREIGKPGSGVFRSADDLRQFRMDANSLGGNHAPNVPHIHFETYAPGAKFPTVNNHVPFFE